MKAGKEMSYKQLLNEKDSISPDGSTNVKGKWSLVPMRFPQLQNIRYEKTFA